MRQKIGLQIKHLEYFVLYYYMIETAMGIWGQKMELVKILQYWTWIQQENLPEKFFFVLIKFNIEETNLLWPTKDKEVNKISWESVSQRNFYLFLLIQES